MVYRDFSKKFGISMYAFYAQIRVKKAKELLNNGTDPALVKQRFGYSQNTSLQKIFSWRKQPQKRKIDLPVAIVFRQDGETFKKVFDKYYVSVLGFAGRMLLNKFAALETAQDIVQELFVRLWEKWEDFFTEQDVKAFLMISTRNAVLNHLRSNTVKNRANEEELYMLANEEQDNSARLINKELTGFLWQKVDQLPQKRRKVFLLRYYQGFSNAQIVEEMCIAMPTVKEHLQEARKELRKLLCNEN
jgi:RNA polymerase sigma-70 factor (ECF subfamily)